MCDMLLTVMFKPAQTHVLTIHVLLMHGFGTLNKLVPGNYNLKQLTKGNKI